MMSERFGVPYYHRRSLLADDDDDYEISSDEGPESAMYSSDEAEEEEEELVRGSSDTSSFDASATPNTPLTPTPSPLSPLTKRDYRSRYRTLSPLPSRRRGSLAPPPSRTVSTPTSSRHTSPHATSRHYHPYARVPSTSARRSSWSTGAPSPLPHNHAPLKTGRPSARSLSAGLASPPHFHYDASGHRPRRASLAPSPTYSSSLHRHRHHDAPDGHVYASRPPTTARPPPPYGRCGAPASPPFDHTHRDSSSFPGKLLVPLPRHRRRTPPPAAPPALPPTSPPQLSIIIERSVHPTGTKPSRSSGFHHLADRQASLAAAESSLAAIQPTLRGPMPMKTHPAFTQTEVESYMEHLVVSTARNTTDVLCNWGTCGLRVPFATLTDHLRTTHGARTASATRVRCCWGGCGKQVRADSLRKHIVSTHERATRCACRLCGFHMARIEAWNVQRHYESCLPKLWYSPEFPGLLRKKGLRFGGVRGWLVEKVRPREAGQIKEEAGGNPPEDIQESEVNDMQMIKEEDI
ncbi:hypothetical protein OF83DRAFT_823182 [Amylostereum chailletii]|nr:hypothetical protein OF83DRAFT_823182 [Amylostereum chailletii]